MRMHCTYRGMPKGTEAMLNSEKIKPIALAVITLHLSEGINNPIFVLKDPIFQMFGEVMSLVSNIVILAKKCDNVIIAS